MASRIEKAIESTSALNQGTLQKDPAAYFYPNLSDVQKQRIQKVQEVLDKRHEKGQTMDKIEL